MDFGTVVQSDSAGKLKCSQCQNYLSCFPISLSAKNLGSFCGRCTSPNETTFFHDTAFEYLCQHLQFPCRYNKNGCIAELYPKDMPQHEDNCYYRPILCPTGEECAWSGLQSDIFHHGRVEHKDVFMKNDGIFHLNFSKRLKPILRKYLLERNNVLYIFEIVFTTETAIFQCALYTNQFEANSKKVACQLSAKVHNKCMFFTFNSTTFSEKRFYEISLESLKTNSETVVQCHISIKDAETNNKHKHEIDKKIMRTLKCSQCQNLVIPPIYCCVHKQLIFCAKCFCTNRMTCAGCKQDKTSKTHFYLDTIAGLLDYPCKNEHNGCTYVCKPDQMEKHFLECDFKNFDCMLDTTDLKLCEWKGPYHNIRHHFEKDHRAKFVANFTLFTDSFEIGKKTTALIEFENRIFYLRYSKDGDEYRWCVQLIGACEVNNFLYEIEIIDNSVNGRRGLSVTKKCLLLKKNLHHINRSDYCYFKNDQLSHLLDSQGCLSFKIHIFIES